MLATPPPQLPHLPRLAHAVRAMTHSRVAVAADRSAEDMVVQTTRSFQEFSSAAATALGSLTAHAVDGAFQAAAPVRRMALRHRRPLETAIAALAGSAEVAALTAVIAVDGRRFVQAFLRRMDDLFDPLFRRLGMTRREDYDMQVRRSVAMATLGYIVLGRLVMFGQRDVVAIGRNFAVRTVRRLGRPA